MLIVEVGVFNLNFGSLENITFENVTILAHPDFRNIRDEVQTVLTDIRTGTIEVNIPNTPTPDESIEYSREILHDFEVLLSFARDIRSRSITGDHIDQA